MEFRSETAAVLPQRSAQPVPPLAPAGPRPCARLFLIVIRHPRRFETSEVYGILRQCSLDWE